ncbi:MAG TPA: ATP cone domain-containing protein [Bacteroidia bacterium]|jgi:hypothetical protein|nr:ATP cone domain-containing protein [Bacteroidia bacterium]
MSDQVTYILKASGERVPFSQEKLGKSLMRSGAGKDSIQFVVDEVKKKLYDGIPSSHIYRMAFGFLKMQSKPVASRYKLKQAIMELGPSGYPFEKYIAEILKHKGFAVRIDEIVKGHCVSHEIDVIAEKGEERFMVECKYHNSTGIVCDVKIPLYIHARFMDVEKELDGNNPGSTRFYRGWVVTNTKFSEDAIKYGRCVGLNLVGWNFPEKGSLRDEIDSSGLYPLTCLISLTRSEKQKLIDNKVVLCREIVNNHQLLMQTGISVDRIGNILKEVDVLCGPQANAEISPEPSIEKKKL